jgi:hypothetical protein
VSVRRVQWIVTPLAALVCIAFFWGATRSVPSAAKPSPYPAPALSPSTSTSTSTSTSGSRSPTASAGTAGSRLDPVPATPIPIPGLKVADVTRAWTARWKKKPELLTTRSGQRRVRLSVPFPGVADRHLVMTLTRMPQAPGTAWGLTCGRDEWAPSLDKELDPVALVDYCLRGVVSKQIYREFLAWAKQVEPWDAVGSRSPDRHQFTGYTGLFVSGGVGLSLSGGTYFPA